MGAVRGCPENVRAAHIYSALRQELSYYRLRAILPELDAIVADGLITIERVEVIAYRAKADPGT